MKTIIVLNPHNMQTFIAFKKFSKRCLLLQKLSLMRIIAISSNITFSFNLLEKIIFHRPAEIGVGSISVGNILSFTYIVRTEIGHSPLCGKFSISSSIKGYSLRTWFTSSHSPVDGRCSGEWRNCWFPSRLRNTSLSNLKIWIDCYRFVPTKQHSNTHNHRVIHNLINTDRSVERDRGAIKLADTKIVIHILLARGLLKPLEICLYRNGNQNAGH